MSYIPDAQVLGYAKQDNFAQATYRQYVVCNSASQRNDKHPKGYNYEGKESAKSDMRQANLWLTTRALRDGDLKELCKLKNDKCIEMPQSILFVCEERHTHIYKWLEDNGYPFFQNGSHYFLQLMKDNTTKTRYVCNHDGKAWINEQLCTLCPEETKKCNLIYINSEY